MILKSFWRKKSTKTYLIILTTLFLTINVLFIAREYVQILSERQYLKTSLVENKSQKDNKEILENDKGVHNLKRAIKIKYITGLKEDTLVINREYFTYSDKDTEYKLNDNEIIIRLSSLDYINSFPLLKDYINQTLTFNYNDQLISFKLKAVISDNKRTELLISDNLFNKYVGESNEFLYTFGFTSEEVKNEFCDKYENEEFGQIVKWDIETAIEIQEREMLEACSKFLNISIYFINIIFIIIIFIVNKNIISDFTKKIDLEYKLGFKKRQIKFNIMKCLLTIHLISFVLVFIANILILLVTNYIIKTEINILDIKIYYLLFGIVLVTDILLSIFKKINIKELKK